jgi:segregation and condensation protein B
MAEDNVKSVIEALLFSSERPLTAEQIRKALDGIGPEQARAAAQQLQQEYESGNRGVRIAEIAGGWQMITAPGFAPFLKKFYKGRQSEKLSKPALETLAIIAYKQPLTRSEIGFLRNVNVDGVMKSLLEKNLVRICGRKKAPGRPHVYGTTRQFLEHFGLKSLQDLPRMEDFPKLEEKADIGPMEEGGKTAEETDGIKEPAQAD